MNENKILSAIKGIKNKPLILIMLISGIFLLVFGGSITSPKNDAEQKNDIISYDMKSYTEELEKRITSLLSAVSGVSDVRVLLTLDGGSEYIYAENKHADNAEYIIISNEGGEEPVIVREIFSNVRGIAVVCRGGNSPMIKATVTELLSSAFDIPKTKISVAGSG